MQEAFTQHRVDGGLDHLGVHAAVAITVIVPRRHEVLVEHGGRRLGQFGGDLDGAFAVGRIVEPLEAGDVVGQEGRHRGVICLDEVVGRNMEYHLR